MTNTHIATQHRFPNDVDTTHNIQIKLFNQIVNTEKMNNDLKERGEEGANQFNEALNTFYTTMKNETLPYENKIKIAKESLETMGSEVLTTTRESITTLTDNVETRPIATIILPIPNDLNNTYNAMWTGQHISVLDTIARDIIDSKSSLGEAAINAFQRYGVSMLERGLRGLAGSFGLNISTAGFKVMFNPYSQLVFSGPSYRNFKFDWVLSPKNGAEAQQLATIIWLLKKYMHPQQSEFDPIWLYPCFAEISINMGSNKRNTFLFKIKDSAIKNVSVNYDNKFHEDGSPIVYKLSLEFMESSLLTQEDFGESYEDSY